MKYFIIILILNAAAVGSHAQTDQQDIDNQVWKPFTRAITTQDVASFVSVHSKDLIRAERDQKRVLDLSSYQSGMETGWPSWKESIKKSNEKYIFELRFLERISNGTLAYEVGYFKNEIISTRGEKHISYGKFQVALRKENGVWKILVDSDSREGGNITDEMFAAAQPINQ